jgi:hypothetical protein
MAAVEIFIPAMACVPRTIAKISVNKISEISFSELQWFQRIEPLKRWFDWNSEKNLAAVQALIDFVG